MTTLSKDEFLALRPEWAKSALVAQFETDESDSQTDYFSTHTTRTVFLGWSKHTRDVFSEMRKAAGTFSETRHLGVANPEFEHREKWSMGAGYYLKASGRYSTGWKVRKTNWFGDSIDVRGAL